MKRNFFSFWRGKVNVNENIISEDDADLQPCTQLTQLNLAHNNFSEVPSSLACLAFNLSRLNLSFNKYSVIFEFIKISIHSVIFSLKEIGPLCHYPHNLRQLDLSHNKIEEWRFVPAADLGFDDSGTSTGSQTTLSHLAPCYALKERSPMKPVLTQGSFSSKYN